MRKIVLGASAYESDLVWHNSELTKNYVSRHKTAIEGYPFLMILIEGRVTLFQVLRIYRAESC